VRQKFWAFHAVPLHLKRQLTADRDQARVPRVMGGYFRGATVFGGVVGGAVFVTVTVAVAVGWVVGAGAVVAVLEAVLVAVGSEVELAVGVGLASKSVPVRGVALMT